MRAPAIALVVGMVCGVVALVAMPHLVHWLIVAAEMMR
jgi:hypothetical protein